MFGLIDPVSIAFYACICAVLAACVNARMRWGVRLFIGALVGICAAGSLPYLKLFLGT